MILINNIVILIKLILKKLPFNYLIFNNTFFSRLNKEIFKFNLLFFIFIFII